MWGWCFRLIRGPALSHLSDTHTHTRSVWGLFFTVWVMTVETDVKSSCVLACESTCTHLARALVRHSKASLQPAFSGLWEALIEQQHASSPSFVVQLLNDYIEHSPTLRHMISGIA